MVTVSLIPMNSVYWVGGIKKESWCKAELSSTVLSSLGSETTEDGPGIDVESGSKEQEYPQVGNNGVKGGITRRFN